MTNDQASFNSLLIRWRQAGGFSEDLRTLLIQSGWHPPLEEGQDVTVAIDKLVSRQRHHDRIAASDMEYAGQAGDKAEEKVWQKMADERREKARQYGRAATILMHLRGHG